MADAILIRGVRERIVNRLRDEILSGRLAEGERLSEVQLAKRFSVSRGPVREAFVQLIHEGLLVTKRNCGVRIAPSAPDSVRKLVTPIRRTIETYALQLVFDDLTEDDFGVLHEILERMRVACRQKDYAILADQDIAFHRFVLERAGQPDLLAIWSTIVARARRHFQKVHLAYKNRLMKVYTRHRALVEAFESGNKAAAVKALEDHII